MKIDKNDLWLFPGIALIVLQIILWAYWQFAQLSFVLIGFLFGVGFCMVVLWAFLQRRESKWRKKEKK